MARQKLGLRIVNKPAPDTTGLRILRLPVRGSDPRWKSIDPTRYAYCHPAARTSDFPVDPTDREVTIAIFPPGHFDHGPTNEEVIAEIARRNLTPPDRAVAETVFDHLKAELAGISIVGICGAVRSLAIGHPSVGYVLVYASARHLGLHGLQAGWVGCQFVAAFGEKPRRS